MIRHNGIVIDRKTLLISVDGRRREFTPPNHSEYLPKGRSVMFETLAFLILHGHATLVDIFDHVYGDSKNGGPNMGPSQFDTFFCLWKGHGLFDDLGLELVSERNAGRRHFWLRRAA